MQTYLIAFLTITLIVYVAGIFLFSVEVGLIMVLTFLSGCLTHKILGSVDW